MDIVYVHLTGAYLFRGMGLPLFFLLTFALTARRHDPKPFRTNAKARFARLMSPWLFWSAVHWLAVVSVVLRGDSDAGAAFLNSPVWSVLTYLWFLPFIWVMEVLANPLLRACRGVPNTVFVPVAVLLGLAALYGPLGYVTVSGVSHEVVKWWLFGLPAIFFGSAIGRLLSVKDARRRARWMLIALGACVWVYLRRGHFWTLHMDAKGYAASVLGADNPAEIMAMLHWDLCRYVLAMLVLLAAMQWRAVNIKPLTYMGTLTIGIYMLHFAVMKYDDLLACIATRLPGVPESAYHSDMLRFALVWCTAAAIVAALKVTPGFRRFV